MVKNAVIIGTHVNAATIVSSLKGLHFSGRIILASGRTGGRGLAGFCHPDVEYWEPALTRPEDLISALADRFGGEETAVLFTDERFHRAFADLPRDRYPWLHFHIGGAGRINTVLDRLEFCSFLSANGVEEVPRTIPGTEDPFKVFGDKFVLRPRCSWYGFERFSVYIIESVADYERAIKECKVRGLKNDDICYQELLSIRDEDNVSVCGWYDAHNQHIYCTHKVLQHPPKNGNGDVIGIIELPQDIMGLALKTLSLLGYDGPFELEFVFDDKTNSYRIIELNPRFWMQHGLVERLTGCALAAHSVDMVPIVSDDSKATRFWVNPLYAIFRALKGDARGLRFAARADSVLPISMWEAACYAPFHMLGKLKR